MGAPQHALSIRPQRARWLTEMQADLSSWGDTRMWSTSNSAAASPGKTGDAIHAMDAAAGVRL
jgi:hypothetical protein